MQKSMPDIVSEGLADGDADDPAIDDQQSNKDDPGTESLDGLSSIAEGSGDDDLLPFRGLIEYDGSDTSEEKEEEESWLGVGTPAANKKRTNEVDTRPRKRKKRETLTAFASYEDYARMIEDAPEDNI
jgi:ribosome biogenesis protein MAK21